MKHMRNFLIFLLGHCLLSHPLHAEVDGLNVLAADREFPRVGRSYQSMDKTYARTGRVRSVAQVRRVQIGSNKTEVIRAVGKPISSYNDGSWIFNISLDYPQNHRLICQYRVWFDENDRVSGTAWRRPQCVKIIRSGHGN